MDSLPPRRRSRGVHQGHGAARKPAGFLDAPQGRDVPHTGGLAAAAAAQAKPPMMLVIHDPWVMEPPPAPVPVFGQYPRGFIGRALPLLRAQRNEVLHVCSGALLPGDGVRIDVRQAARPDFRADGRALPFKDGVWRAVLLDPPYTAEYAKSLYETDYPLPSHLLAEAARVVMPGGRIGFVHYLVPYPPPECRFVCVRAISTGCGYMLRALTIFERDPERLC